MTPRDFYWFLVKLIRKIRFNIFGFKANYPSSILSLIKSIRLEKDIWTGMYLKKAVNTVQSESRNPKTLMLATGQFDTSKLIDQTGLEDCEDLEAIHRFNWILYEISKSVSTDAVISSTWVEEKIEKWCKGQVAEANPHYALDSYTTSERISNILLSYYHFQIEPSEAVIARLKTDVSALLEKLEFMAFGYGNHLFNNARALYLYSVFFNNLQMRRLALSIIGLIYNKLVAGSFLREGSTHYHLLFTRWTLELYYFASLKKDSVLTSILGVKLEKMLEGCQLICRESEIPLIGDISPDFPPSWLHSILASEIVLHYFPKYWQKINESGRASWSNLFCSGVPAPNEQERKTEEQGWSLFPKSGFHIYTDEKKYIFLKAFQQGAYPWANHAHSDDGSFVYFFNKIPIIIDVGRKSYEDREVFNRDLSPFSHNLTIADGFTEEVSPFYKFPHSWNKREIRVEENQNNLIITKSPLGNQKKASNKLIRELSPGEDSLLVKDHFEADQSLQKITCFYLSPLWELQENSKNKFVFNYLNLRLVIAIEECSELYSCELLETRRSTAYGIDEKTTFLKVDWGRNNVLRINFKVEEMICVG